jgi:tetratricopeptide (TPR) repeat protein
MIHMRLGNIPDGVDSLFAALEVAQRGSDRMQETVIRMNLANTFIELHDFEVAAAWLEQCLAVARPFETDPIIFECTQSLAVCEEQLGRPQRALTLLDEAIALAERLEFPFGMAESSYDQGRLFLELGETKKAMLAFERSLTNFRKMDIPAAQVRIAMCQWQL